MAYRALINQQHQLTQRRKPQRGGGAQHQRGAAYQWHNGMATRLRGIKRAWRIIIIWRRRVGIGIGARTRAWRSYRAYRAWHHRKRRHRRHGT